MNLIDIIVDIIVDIIIILSLFFLLLCMDATLNKISDKKCDSISTKLNFYMLFFISHSL